MKTNYQMLLDFEPFKFQNRGWISESETALIKKNFKIAERTDVDLQNLRDFVVMFYATKVKEEMTFNDSLKEKDKKPDNTFELMDKMSAIVAVIDEEKFHRGLEV